jgi:hypothetical protein
VQQQISLNRKKLLPRGSIKFGGRKGVFPMRSIVTTALIGCLFVQIGGLAAHSECAFPNIAEKETVSYSMTNGNRAEFISQISRLYPTEGAFIASSLLESASPTPENFDRLTGAGIIYAEILTRWNRAVYDFETATEFVSKDVKKQGVIAGLVLPLAAMVEASASIKRSDVGSLAVLGLGQVNPLLANYLCKEMSLTPVVLETARLPGSVQKEGLEPNTRMALQVHYMLNTIPPLIQSRRLTVVKYLPGQKMLSEFFSEMVPFGGPRKSPWGGRVP